MKKLHKFDFMAMQRNFNNITYVMLLVIEITGIIKSILILDKLDF